VVVTSLISVSGGVTNHWTTNHWTGLDWTGILKFAYTLQRYAIKK